MNEWDTQFISLSDSPTHDLTPRLPLESALDVPSLLDTGLEISRHLTEPQAPPLPREPSKTRLSMLTNLSKHGWSRYEELLSTCRRSYTTFDCTENAEHRKYAPRKCKLRICEYEEPDRLRRLKPFMDAVSKTPGSFRLITLTTGEALSAERYAHYRKAIVRFYHSLEAHVSGGIMVMELSPKNGLMHFHLIVKGPKYLPQKWLSERWKKATGGAYIVDIRKARAKTGANYIMKYLVKAMPAPPGEDIGAILSMLVHKRTLTTYGCFYGLERTEKRRRGDVRCPWCDAPMVISGYHERPIENKGGNYGT